jgi:hypothetical protein
MAVGEAGSKRAMAAIGCCFGRRLVEEELAAGGFVEAEASFPLAGVGVRSATIDEGTVQEESFLTRDEVDPWGEGFRCPKAVASSG